MVEELIKGVGEGQTAQKQCGSCFCLAFCFLTDTQTDVLSNCLYVIKLSVLRQPTFTSPLPNSFFKKNEKKSEGSRRLRANDGMPIAQNTITVLSKTNTKQHDRRKERDYRH
jgi:hypothetical protein